MSAMNDTESKSLQPRHWLLGGGLAIALAATMWASQTGTDDDAVQPVAGDRRSGDLPTTPAQSAAKTASKTAVETPEVTNWNPVDRQTWAPVTPAELAAWSPPPPPPAPPPPPPPPPQVAPAPVAPTFPYQLIGRMEEKGANNKPVAVVFLSGPSRSLGAHAGEVIDGQWRVDQITPQGLNLTWLPAQLKHTIAFPSAL